MRENEIEPRDVQTDPAPGDVKWKTADPKKAMYMLGFSGSAIRVREMRCGSIPRGVWESADGYSYGTADEHAAALAKVYAPPAPPEPAYPMISVAALNTLLDVLTAYPEQFPGESIPKRLEVLNMHAGRCQVAQAIRDLIAKVGG
jgi:hypothetical protein